MIKVRNFQEIDQAAHIALSETESGRAMLAELGLCPGATCGQMDGKRRPCTLKPGHSGRHA